MVQGRPLNLNERLTTSLLNAIRSGATLDKACAFAGIDSGTLRRWRSRGEAALKVPPGRRNPTQRRLVDFCADLDEAMSAAEVRYQTQVHLIATAAAFFDEHGNRLPTPSIEQQRVSLQAAQWWLSHRSRDTYTTRQEVTGKDGTPLELSPSEAFAIFRELAAAQPEPIED